MVKLPSGQTEIYMTYLAVICSIFTGLYCYLAVKEKEIPVFIPTTIGGTLAPIIYTLKPKVIG